MTFWRPPALSDAPAIHFKKSRMQTRIAKEEQRIAEQSISNSPENQIRFEKPKVRLSEPPAIVLSTEAPRQSVSRVSTVDKQRGERSVSPQDKQKEQRSVERSPSPEVRFDQEGKAKEPPLVSSPKDSSAPTIDSPPTDYGSSVMPSDGRSPSSRKWIYYDTCIK
jgi:hypothetical protein